MSSSTLLNLLKPLFRVLMVVGSEVGRSLLPSYPMRSCRLTSEEEDWSTKQSRPNRTEAFFF